MIVRYQVVNPDPFLFHSHIETHLSNGKTVALFNGVDSWPQVAPGEDKSPGAAQSQGADPGNSAGQGQVSGQPEGHFSWPHSAPPTPIPTKLQPKPPSTAIPTLAPTPGLQSSPVLISTPALVPTAAPDVEPYGGRYKAHRGKGAHKCWNE